MKEIILMEVTPEEKEIIMCEREKVERRRRCEAYAAELNDIIARAEEEGFVIAASHTFKDCDAISYAFCWCAAENYIGLR